MSGLRKLLGLTAIAGVLLYGSLEADPPAVHAQGTSPTSASPTATPTPIVVAPDAVAVEVSAPSGTGVGTPIAGQLRSTVTWRWAGGAGVDFEVERATPLSGELASYSSVGTVGYASKSPAGTFVFEEPYPAGAVRVCYRVRAHASNNNGPFSNEACSQQVPTSGGQAATPAPPTVGSGGGRERSGFVNQLFAVLGASALLVSAGFALRSRLTA